MVWQKFILLMISIAALAGCQSLGLYYANLPHKDSVYHTRISNISYGKDKRQKLDIYLPAESIAEKGSLPVIVFFYGGGWSSGSKDDYIFVGDTLARAGFMVAIVDYIKYPEARYPAFVKDAAAATDWLRQYVADYGGNPDNMHLLGHSAGAHIAMMLVADEHYLKEYGMDASVYRSVTGLAGPYHFTPTEKKYIDIFRGKEHFHQMQASHFIDGTEPPMLLLHGNDDTVVGKGNIERLQAAIKEHNGKLQVKYYDDIGHLSIIGAFSKNFATKAPIVSDAIKFMQVNQK